VWELGGYLVLGVLSGVFSAFLIRTMSRFEDFFAKLPIHGVFKPVIGFALVGLIGCQLPYVFGNGYETTNLALHEALPLGLLLILPVAKLLATALTRASGGAGGLFTPPS